MHPRVHSSNEIQALLQPRWAPVLTQARAALRTRRPQPKTSPTVIQERLRDIERKPHNGIRNGLAQLRHRTCNRSALKMKTSLQIINKSLLPKTSHQPHPLIFPADGGDVALETTRAPLPCSATMVPTYVCFPGLVMAKLGFQFFNHLSPHLLNCHTFLAPCLTLLLSLGQSCLYRLLHCFARLRLKTC